jgi:polyisoprenoid-binding protein YceI
VKAKLFATTLLAAPLMVGFMTSTRLPLEPSSTLWVEGTSTVKSFKCTAKKLDAQVVADPAASVAQMVEGANVVIPVEQLDCGNGTMNEHMRKALQADKAPTIEFALASYDLNAGNATLKGTLKIAGTTRPIEIPAVVTEAGKEIRVKASKVINMKEWGVKPPSLMMGTMKVKENVTVGFDVAIKH